MVQLNDFIVAVVGMAAVATTGQDSNLAAASKDQKVCRRLSRVVEMNKVKVDIGKCAGYCKPALEPYIPATLGITTEGNPRHCKPKRTGSVMVPYKKITKCSCVGDDAAHGVTRREDETDEDVLSRMTWEHRGDIFEIDQKITISEDSLKKCRLAENWSEIGKDFNGEPITVDIGRCTGVCPVVFQDPKLAINLTLTADDEIQEVWIDGVDHMTSMNNAGAWTRSDTILQTVSRNPGTEHVIAIKARDISSVVQGLIATVSYDGAIQHVTNDEWLSTRTEPQDISGKKWYESGYDRSNFANARQCTTAETYPWGSYWPAAFYGDGAEWIWGPDSECYAYSNEDPAWFILAFTIPKIPQTSCSAVERTSMEIAVETVEACDCQCTYKEECKQPEVWNELTCACECGLAPSSCPAGTIFNSEKCMCENCGICDFDTKEECVRDVCLHRFAPQRQDWGAGQCVWRDWNGDSKPSCGCPQNKCQTRTLEECESDDECELKSNGIKQCDRKGTWA